MIATEKAFFQSRRAWVPPTRAPSELASTVQIRRRFLFTITGATKATRWQGHKHLMHSIGYWCARHGLVIQSYERDKAGVDSFGFGTAVCPLASLKRMFEERYRGMNIKISEVKP